MASNKTKRASTSVAKFVDALKPDAKRSDTKIIIGMMRRAADEKPNLWGSSIIGFGTYHYRYDSGHEGDMPLIGFSPRKSAIVLYLMTGFKDFELLLSRLGKYRTSKACLYINKLADVDQKVLETLIVKSVAAARKRYHP
jgi:Domain of unknown function (DU1801)